MSLGLPLYTSIGSGTYQSNTAGNASVCAVVPNANSQAGDLVIVVCLGALGGGSQTTQDVTATRDNGDGWILLSSGYDITGKAGLLLAACIAPRAGSSGYAGLVFNSNTFYYGAQSHTFRIAPPAWLEMDQYGRDNGWVYNSGSGTALDAPAINQPYQQVIDLVGRGYNNGGTTTTVGNITNFTERFDTGDASSNVGIALNDRTAAITGAVQNPLVTSALSVAKTQRMGLRAMVPIMGNSINRGRMQGSRRLFG